MIECSPVQKWLEDQDDALLTADGFDEAILGIAFGSGRPDCVIYDYNRCVKILMERDGMSEEDAIEFMDFNVTDAWLGKTTPLFLRKPPA